MAREIPLVHPGATLYEEWLQPLGITQYKLAQDIGVDARRINAICNGTRSITEDTALLLGKCFGVDGASFLELQSHYDLERARENLVPSFCGFASMPIGLRSDGAPSDDPLRSPAPLRPHSATRSMLPLHAPAVAGQSISPVPP